MIQITFQVKCEYALIIDRGDSNKTTMQKISVTIFPIKSGEREREKKEKKTESHRTLNAVHSRYVWRFG